MTRMRYCHYTKVNDKYRGLCCCCCFDGDNSGVKCAVVDYSNRGDCCWFSVSVWSLSMAYINVGQSERGKVPFAIQRFIIILIIPFLLKGRDRETRDIRGLEPRDQYTRLEQIFEHYYLSLFPRCSLYSRSLEND